MHQSWAETHGVNLLASGANIPQQGSTGSGIYSGSLGALVSQMSEVANTRVLIASVPKTPGLQLTPDPPVPTITATKDNIFEANQSELRLIQEDLKDFEISELDFDQNATQQGSICNGGFCCDYDIEVTPRQVAMDSVSYSYAVVAFKGLRRVGFVAKIYLSIAACGLVTCTKSSARETCGLR